MHHQFRVTQTYNLSGILYNEHRNEESLKQRRSISYQYFTGFLNAGTRVQPSLISHTI